MAEGFVVAEFLIVLIPALVLMLALPIGLRWRGTDPMVRAVYLFHWSGDPLATVASEFVPPMAAAELGPVLVAVRAFVEAPFGGITLRPTVQRFGDEAIVAVRGRFVSACAVYRGSSDGPLGHDLVRIVREFESANEPALGSWSSATSTADVAFRAMSELVASRGISRRSGESSSAPSWAAMAPKVPANRAASPT